MAIRRRTTPTLNQGCATGPATEHGSGQKIQDIMEIKYWSQKSKIFLAFDLFFIYFLFSFAVRNMRLSR